MSKFFHLTKKPATKICQRKKVFRKMKIDIKILNLVIIGLIVVMSITYLIQVNSFAVKGYKIKELEKKITELKQAGKSLELQVLNLQSMDNVQSKVDQLNMVAVGKTEYLMPTPVVLATK